MVKIISWFIDEKGKWYHIEIEVIDDLNFKMSVDGVEWESPKNIGNGLLDFSEMCSNG